MCGRYQLAITGQQLAGLLDARVGAGASLPATWNAAPSLAVPVLALAPSGERVLDVATWGLVPSWARRPGTPSRPLVNARAESLLQKPSFAAATRAGRILVPVTGFYEWTGERGAKEPWSIRVRGAAVDPFTGQRLEHEAGPDEPAEPFLLAAISETWVTPDNVPERTFTIVTVPANPLCARIHERMPAIFDGAAADAWLANGSGSVDELVAALAPYPAERMEAWQVGRDVNHAANDGPLLARPA